MNKITIIFFLLFSSKAFSQFSSSSEIFLQMKKLKVLGSVLYVGAHPDDENNTLLPYLAKEKLYRTAYLSLTRGEGGQNLIGNEQGIDLGLIRTQELLAARNIDGCEQYFTRAFEFGYSKTLNETMKMWDKEKLLEDVVWMIRKYQPDIIIARFPPDGRAGHGHHAASALIANEAFFLAADSTKFTHQFAMGVTTHQAKRILWNTFNFGGNNTTAENQLKIDVGVYNNLLGMSYGEIGAIARTMHKSQGEGRPKRRGILYEYFSHTAGEKATTDLMDNVELSWKKITNNNIDNLIDSIINQFDFTKPELSVTALNKLYKEVQNLPNSNWKIYKLNAIQEIVEACSGVFIEAVSSQEKIVQGDTLKASCNVYNRKNIPVIVSKISVEQFDTTVLKTLLNNSNFSLTKQFAIDANRKITQPYWLEKPMQHNMFEVDDKNLIGEPNTPPAYVANIKINIAGQEYDFKKPILYKYVDPVRGELYQPLTLLPKLTVEVNAPIVMKTNDRNVNALVTAQANTKNIEVKFNSSKELSSSKNEFIFDENKNLQQLSIQIKSKNETIYPIELVEPNTQNVFNKTLHQIQYNHIPNINYFTNASIEVKNLNVKTVGKKVGYIIGAGDFVPEGLQQLGYEVDILNEKDIVLSNLIKYQAIITGIRAYNIFDWLLIKNEILNEYVKNGGNLIVQYLKSNTLNGKKIQAGPYPFSISAQLRITEEDAEVNFAIPKHVVFHQPNEISQADFKNWIQERSTYQIEKADSSFIYPLSINDTNEKSSNGSLAIAKYGKGNMVYLSLAMFRQLPAGVSGAYRLMANIISLPKN
jgi:LmbE family N-acetylglucosaminyl deacetylase